MILLVLAAIAIPVEWRPLGRVTMDPGFDRVQSSDFLANIAGFVPVGMVLAELGLLRAVLVAALISTFAETSQLVMMYRAPAASDVASNVIGAILGTVICARWGFRPVFRIDERKALVATALAVAFFLGVQASSGDVPSTRGATSPGMLEAHWTFDETGGRDALDSSGNRQDGRFRHQPRRVAGVRKGAVTFDGQNDYIDFGHSTALRLAGSMTISAWINSSSFPFDDAAIVSQVHGKRGYQLDTTVDRKLRTIGFKLTSACGELMARYGVTPLTLGTWYHVAGVYDAERQTMDVYLNGEPDNGFLLGPVTGTQLSSRWPVYVGRRQDLKSFEFAGSIDDVRIYSYALTKAEIAADMRGSTTAGRAENNSHSVGRSTNHAAPCAVYSEPEDRMVPGIAASFGALVAVVCVGLWPQRGLLLPLAASLAAGLLLVPATASTLPAISLWTVPLVSLAGGASIAVSVRHRDKLG